MSSFCPGNMLQLRALVIEDLPLLKLPGTRELVDEALRERVDPVERVLEERLAVLLLVSFPITVTVLTLT